MRPRYLKLLATFWLTALTLGASMSPGAASLRVLTPTNDAVSVTPEVLLTFTAPAGKPLAIRLNGEIRDLPDRRVPGDAEDVHHVQVPLEEGPNTLHLLDKETETVLETVRILRTAPYAGGSVGPESYAFHTREREAECSGCHSLPEAVSTESDRPTTPAGKVCAACHSDVEAAPSLHGPLAVYACFMCHDPDSTPARFAQRSDQTEACVGCHEGFVERVMAGKTFLHGPVAAGACLVCHDPHGGENSSLVRSTGANLCLLCHAETLPLPVSRGLHGAMPCTDCHDPHGGATVLFTWAEGNAFCTECHPDVTSSGSGHPIDGHPVEAAADPSRPGRPLECLSCHGPHALRDISKLNIIEDEGAQRRFCRKCHS